MLSLAQVIKDVKDNIENILNIMAPKAYVDKKVADLVNGAPEQLDTLQELSKALNNDKDFGATVNNAIAKKLDSAGGTITGDLTVNGSLAAKASTAGTADRALKADACTGNAATASSVAWSGITNKPSTFTPSSHNHDSVYPSTTGVRASGTWGISISGKAATAGTADTAKNVAWGNVTGKSNMTGATANAAGAAGLVPAPEAGKQEQFLRGDGTWQTPANTTYSDFVKSGSTAAHGLVPKPSTTAGTTHYLREDGTWTVPPDTTYSNFVKSGSGAKAGLVPAPSTTAGTKKYLREDGTWQVPPDNNTTYSAMTAATADAAGKAGLVPAPAKGKQASFLRGDGAWAVPANTTYANFVKSGASAAAGLVPKPSTTAGTTHYLREDGTWAVPPDTNTTYSSMKAATADAAGGAGLVPAPAAGAANRYLRSDGKWVVPPDNNTTYGNMKGATASAAGGAGLVPAPAKGKQSSFLRGDGAWATPTNTTYSVATQSANGLMSAADKKKLDTHSSLLKVSKWDATSGTLTLTSV